MKRKYKRGSAREAKSIQHRKLDWASLKWGEVCEVCKRRKGTFFASSGAEGGRNSVCECD